MSTRSERIHEAFEARKEALGFKYMSDLAVAADVPKQNLRKWMAARGDARNAPLEACEKIGAILGYNAKWLFSGKGAKLQKPPAPPEGGVDVALIPILDSVAAGRLANPVSQVPVEDVPLLAFADLGSGDFFALRVDGSSMDRVSPDGSIIVVNRNDKTLISGKCYVFSHRGETTYKRWQGGEPAYLDPYSTDPIHKPIFLHRKKDMTVVGRVKRTVLDL